MRGYRRTTGRRIGYRVHGRGTHIGRSSRVFKSTRSSGLGRALGHSAYTSIMKSGNKKSNTYYDIETIIVNITGFITLLVIIRVLFLLYS